MNRFGTPSAGQEHNHRGTKTQRRQMVNTGPVETPLESSLCMTTIPVNAYEWRTCYVERSDSGISRFLSI